MINRKLKIFVCTVICLFYVNACFAQDTIDTKNPNDTVIATGLKGELEFIQGKWIDSKFLDAIVDFKSVSDAFKSRGGFYFINIDAEYFTTVLLKKALIVTGYTNTANEDSLFFENINADSVRFYLYGNSGKEYLDFEVTYKDTFLLLNKTNPFTGANEVMRLKRLHNDPSGFANPPDLNYFARTEILAGKYRAYNRNSELINPNVLFNRDGIFIGVGNYDKYFLILRGRIPDYSQDKVYFLKGPKDEDIKQFNAPQELDSFRYVIKGNRLSLFKEGDEPVYTLIKFR